MQAKIILHNRLIISIILLISLLGCTLSTQIKPTITPQPQITTIPEVGDISYRISEAELVKMLLENAGNIEQFTILEPVITLDNDIAQLSAILQTKPSANNNPILTALDGKFECQFSITLNESNQPVINIILLNVNGIPVPGMFLDQFSSLISSTIITNLQSSFGESIIKYINIDDGFITVITGNN